jgi:hypothetical protein
MVLVFHLLIKKKIPLDLFLLFMVFTTVLRYLLIPMSRIAEAGGPMKMTPSFSHSSANSVFSDRNP